MRVLEPEQAIPARGRVAVLVPRWTDRSQVEPQGTPFRSFNLAGAFLAAGHEVVFFDQEHDLDRTDRLAELDDELATCVAAFVWLNELYPCNQFANAALLTAELKRRRPALPVVVGGEFITICPPEFFDIDTQVDFFLRGYGEDTGVRLVEHLAAGREPADVAGLVWRGADGSLRQQPTEPKALFRPAFLELYRRLDLSCYVQTGGVFGNDQPTLAVSTGRGCVKGCRFCAWSNHPSRILGARETFDLLAFLRDRYDVRQFHIAELDFFMSRKRALELAALIARHRPDIRWYALGSPIDLIGFTDDEWDQLRDGGLLKVEMGSESGSPRLLRSIGKRHGPDHIVALSAKMLARGIVPMNNFLFGFPGETHADRAASLEVIARLIDLSLERTHMTYRHYQPAWGTGMGEEALAEIPDRPRRVDRWLAERPRYADEGARTMPWLPLSDEREVKRLLNFELPLASSRLPVASAWKRSIYLALRARAQRGLRTGGRARRLDRWLYDALFGVVLNRTYVA